MTAEQAFKALKGQINHEIDHVKNASQELMQTNHFAEARKLAEKGEKLMALKEEINRLNRKWRQYFPQVEMLPGIEGGDEQTPGKRTPQGAYYIPILQALVEKNGRGRTREIVNRVGEMMAGILNEYDQERLATGNRPRWRNTAEWARNDLREKGLIKSGSPHGIWEISEAGREYLKRQGR